MEKREPWYIFGGNADWCSHFGKQKNSIEFPQKTKNGTACDPAIPLLGVYPKNPVTPIQKNLYTPVFTAAQFTVAKVLEAA